MIRLTFCQDGGFWLDVFFKNWFFTASCLPTYIWLAAKEKQSADSDTYFYRWQRWWR